jgi:hypothetical protein
MSSHSLGFIPFAILPNLVKMADSTPAEGTPEYMQQMQKKLADIIDNKKYIDEPGLLPWYKKDLAEMKPPARELFEKYSNVAPAEVESHIKTIVRMQVYLQGHGLNTQIAG